MLLFQLCQCFWLQTSVFNIHLWNNGCTRFGKWKDDTFGVCDTKMSACFKWMRCAEQTAICTAKITAKSSTPVWVGAIGRTRAFSTSRRQREMADAYAHKTGNMIETDNSQAMTELIRDFIQPESFAKMLTSVNMDFYCGVPDSLLKDFCAYIAMNIPPEKHVITANEGSAVALAAGYHMATGRYATVYLQNSGLGNAVNPLLSLADRKVYQLPMLLLIGWRGEPGKKDEPQHRVQGQLTAGLLASMHIPFQILPDYEEGALQALHTATHHMDSVHSPYCLLVKRQTFTPYKLDKSMYDLSLPLRREEAVKLVVDSLSASDVIVGTTGMLSRELYEYRLTKGEGHQRDFLTVGSMGHASLIALGIAQQKPSRQVVCLDGDGAAIMHLGSWATIGQVASPNLKHIIFNNGMHGSVGGQPTAAFNKHLFSFSYIALGCGYKHVWKTKSEDETTRAVQELMSCEGPAMLEIQVAPGYREDLGRPASSPVKNKKDFMKFLRED